MNKQEKMLALVKEWKETGESIRIFAKNNNIPHTKLEYWIRKEKRIQEYNLHSKFIEITRFSHQRK